MWDFSTESPHFNTLSIWDKRHRWKSRSTSKRWYVSSIATVRTGWKVVVRLYGTLLLLAKCPRPPGRWENHHTKDQSTIHQFGKKVLPGIFLGHELIAGGIWKGDILIADLEDLENLDASDIYPRRIKAKRYWSLKKMMNSYSQSQMVQQNCQEETTISEYPLKGRNNL